MARKDGTQGTKTPSWKDNLRNLNPSHLKVLKEKHARVGGMWTVVFHVPSSGIHLH